MKGAIAVLKKAGGRRFSIYELPWYVIIVFPGTGMTTSLVYYGL
jgi:type VI protein secretion system component VasK